MVQRSALCRSRRELSDEYLLANFGFDTAENEPSFLRVYPNRPTRDTRSFTRNPRSGTLRVVCLRAVSGGRGPPWQRPDLPLAAALGVPLHPSLPDARLVAESGRRPSGSAR